MLTLKQVYDIGKYINFEITNNKKSVNVSFIGTKVPCFEKIYTPAARNLFLNISAFCFVVYHKIKMSDGKKPNELIYQNLLTRFQETTLKSEINKHQFLFNRARDYVNMDISKQASLDSYFLDFAKENLSKIKQDQQEFFKNLDAFVDKMYNLKDSNYGQ